MELREEKDEELRGTTYYPVCGAPYFIEEKTGRKYLLWFDQEEGCYRSQKEDLYCCEGE